MPSGVAVIGSRQNNVLISEAGVPASPPITSGRTYAEITDVLDTGLAIANPNSTPATITFFFTDGSGINVASGSTLIGANAQLSKFLDQPPYNLASPFQGTFTFTSNIPVAAVALRGLKNERGEFLMSTLPVIDTMATPVSGVPILPDYADGGGWTTQILLVNPTDTVLTGKLQVMSTDGMPSDVTIAYQTGNVFQYSIPPRSSQKFVTEGSQSTTATGSMRIVPDGPTDPASEAVFSYKPQGITVSEAAGLVATGTAVRMYVEASGISGQPDNIQSGFAVASSSSSKTNLTFELTQLDGTPLPGVAPVSFSLAGGGQLAKLLPDIFPNLPNPFKGVLRISTASSAISVIGLRNRYNERSDFLMTTMPAGVENTPSIPAQLTFPHLVDGGGYTTQLILLSGTTGRSAGNLRFYDTNGQSLNLTLQ
jgi:hypothetical protein